MCVGFGATLGCLKQYLKLVSVIHALIARDASSSTKTLKGPQKSTVWPEISIRDRETAVTQETRLNNVVSLLFYHLHICRF